MKSSASEPGLRLQVELMYYLEVYRDFWIKSIFYAQFVALFFAWFEFEDTLVHLASKVLHACMEAGRILIITRSKILVV